MEMQRSLRRNRIPQIRRSRYSNANLVEIDFSLANTEVV